MSRVDRDRERQRARMQAAGVTDRAARRPLTPPPPPRSATPSIREQLADASAAQLALLVVRVFFGVTFLYAGIDKLLDPAFLNASSPTGIAAQLDAFTQGSPLAALITPMQPFAVPIGLLISLAEIAIGIGALTGLAFRLAAVGGAALSLLFWLTASWNTKPYYYGADLPYAAGWIALAIAGHGNLLVPAAVLRIGESKEPFYPTEPGVDATRRLVLQAGALGAAALAVGSLSVPLRLFRGATPSPSLGGSGVTGRTGGTAGTAATGATGGTATTTPGPGPTAAPGASATPPASFTPSGLTVTTTSAVDAKGAVRVRIPANAPGSLPGGDPAIIVKLQDGTYAAYDAICTHEGCKVGWDAQDEVMLCPCHGAAFDPNDHGAVLQGPTRTPLAEFPLDIDGKTGAITLRA